MRAGVRRAILGYVPLVLGTIIVCTGAYFVGLSAITNMQRTHAEYVAETFAKDLAVDVSELKQVAQGQVSGLAGNAILSSMRQLGTVVKFQVFDQNGEMRGESTFLSKRYTITPDQAVLTRQAKEVLSSGRTAFTLEEGFGPRQPKYFSRIMIPLSVGMNTVGVLAVYSDETATWPGMLAQFQSVVWQVTILIAIAFGIPAVLVVRRSRQLRLAARRLRHTTQYDDLTGTLNRATFKRTMQELVDHASERDLSVAVHFIDLDRFKDVNDTRGHAAGDEVLRLATERLRKLLGSRERIARLGGDEFAVCQPYYVNSPQVVSELANDIVKAMAKPFALESGEIQIGASVGYSYYPRDGRTVDDLVRAADIALYKAKQTSRGRAVAFDPSMEIERQARQGIEQRLRVALANQEFEVYFQPLFESASGALRGFEALLRLRDNNGRPISPAEFIPIAEEIGLIGEIGLWVLRESCRTVAKWPEALTVSVNLSPAQFQSASMANVVRDVLAETGLAPRRLELEVTESLLITDTEKVLQELKAIKALGVSIALDDFGTGYSSLSYLWRFPFDKLKVDKSFMTDLAIPSSKSREILSTIIALGRVLDLKVTAEGVETEEQASVLRDLHCDLVQGFLFGRPMPVSEVAATVMQDVARQTTTGRKPGLRGAA